MANPKLSTLVDAFTSTTINTTLWNNVTAGAATLDTVNDEVALAVPTTVTTNTFGTNNLYDATGSSVYACVGVAANGNGNIRTVMRIRFDATNAAAMRFEFGVFKLTAQTAGTSTTLTLPTYNADAHRWWRLREAGGSFYAGVSPDGLTWTELGSLAYGFDATNVTFRFETAATATEVAGNVATISHVNTLTGGPFNLNWPRMDDGWGAEWNANAGTSPQGLFVDVTDRTRESVTAQRGRQYELDQVRAGEASLTLANTDGALDPVNAFGPWAGRIQPYQPYRQRAQWPPTRNMLTQFIATGGDLGDYEDPDTLDILSDAGPVGPIGTSSAWRGNWVFDVTVPAADFGGDGWAVIRTSEQLAVMPGVTYTNSMWVRNVSASGSIVVNAYIAWYTAGANALTYADGSTATLTGSTTAGWTRVTVTATAPANVTGVEIGLQRSVGTSFDAEVQIDGWQMERGTVASAWGCPGVTYPVYSGFMERWPSSWSMSGTYGTVQPNAVDALALLSQVQLPDPLTAEINANGPRFLYRLDDPADSMSAADATGNYPAVPIAISKYGAGSLTFGNSVTSNSASGGFTGSSGTVVRINNANPGSNQTAAASYLNLAAVGITGPADPGQWTRMIAFRYTGPTPTQAACLWSSMDRQRASGAPSGSRIYLYILTDGCLYLFMTGADGSTIINRQLSLNVVDGNWHLVTFGFDFDHQEVPWSFDGIPSGDIGTYTTKPSGLAGDSVGGFVDITVGNGTTWNFQGDIAFACEWPTVLDSNAIRNMYAAWRQSCAGESTDARYARILRYGGYTGATVLDSGLTTSMGPAGFEGKDVVSALEEVVTTENGEHFVDRSGMFRFKSRAARYNAATPAYTFGERADLGEWPYEDLTLDYDSTHLSNQVTVTQQSTGQNFYASDAASVAAYFPRSMSRTVNSASVNECQDAANYLLSRYKQPATRVSSIKLHPSGNPAMWPVCLSLELGTRVRVMRRPPGLPAVQVDCFVENIQWELDATGEAWVTLQCSPTDLTPYGIFAATHTSLAGSITAGVSTLSINAPQVTQIYNWDFASAGTWRVVGGNAALGPITTALDGSTTVGKATTYTVMEDSTSIPYDPTKTYRVSVTIRTATAPTGTPNVYVGLTGIDANGNRVNTIGANSLSSQIYCAARGVQPGSTYTTYTGYVSGTATPGDGGPNPDPTNPERVRPEVVAVRPLAHLLYQCTDGVQYIDQFTIHTVPTGGGLPAAQQLGPGQQLVLGQNTTNQETVTVQSVSTTSPGWTTATLTLQAATTKAHTAGDLVCEPLPTAVTDPTKWDAIAKFDSVAFAY